MKVLSWLFLERLEKESYVNTRESGSAVRYKAIRIAMRCEGVPTLLQECLQQPCLLTNLVVLLERSSQSSKTRGTLYGPQAGPCNGL